MVPAAPSQRDISAPDSNLTIGLQIRRISMRATTSLLLLGGDADALRFISKRLLSNNSPVRHAGLP